MPVYFASPLGSDMVKIGHSDRPERRLRDLGREHRRPMALLRVAEGDCRTEKWFHAAFAEHHVAGEWFRFDLRMLAVDAPPPPAQWDAVWPAATSLGVKAATLMKWRQRGNVPPKWRWPIVQAAIKQGVPLTMNDFGEAA